MTCIYVTSHVQHARPTPTTDTHTGTHTLAYTQTGTHTAAHTSATILIGDIPQFYDF